jgi:hypothetical protein
MLKGIMLFVLAGSALGQQVYRYKQGDASTHQEYIDGNLYRTIHANGITVGVMFSEAPKAFRASVAVMADEGAASRGGLEILNNIKSRAVAVWPVTALAVRPWNETVHFRGVS